MRAAGGYVTFEAGAGERVEVHYPLHDWSASYEVGNPGRQARCVGYWRGETLLAVEPLGEYYPLYQRGEAVEPVDPRPPAGPPIDSL